MAKRSAPEVNAGSMADIAFLLLIFFLVTTTIEVDSGISSKLPPDIPPPEVKIKQKNIFTVELNKDNQMLVEEELMKIKDLKAAAIKFIDNGQERELRELNVIIVTEQRIQHRLTIHQKLSFL